MKRVHLLILFFSAAGLVSNLRAASTPADFTHAYAKVLKQRAPNLDFKIVADLELRIADESKEEKTVFLHNAYDSYKQAPNDGHAVILRYIDAILGNKNFGDAEIDRSRIVPIIKDRAWLDETRTALKLKGSDITRLNHVWDEYNDELVILYAEDNPNAIRYLGVEHIEKLGLNRLELRNLAVANLQKAVAKIELRGTPEFYVMTAGGNYEASLLLEEKIWTGGQVKVDGEIVVAVPSRDMLLITGSKNPGGIAKLKKLADETVKSAPYRLTPQLFVFRGGKFVPFTK